ncbi:MAG: hypothetical protein IPF66_12470 [Holophagales bacterium]|nr:hypothetical protein [Holophagales bacterium]
MQHFLRRRREGPRGRRKGAPRGGGVVTTRVRAFAPATVANLGPGFDVLGAALDGPGDSVTAWRSKKPGVRIVEITGDQGRLPLDSEKNTASVAATHVLEAAIVAGRATPRTGIEISLEKGLPLASGLGSSAASAAAGAKAVALLLGETRKKVLLEAVLRGEHAADGSWHGDNGFASILGGLVLVPSSDPADFVSRSLSPYLPDFGSSSSTPTPSSKPRTPAASSRARSPSPTRRARRPPSPPSSTPFTAATSRLPEGGWAATGSPSRAVAPSCRAGTR